MRQHTRYVFVFDSITQARHMRQVHVDTSIYIIFISIFIFKQNIKWQYMILYRGVEASHTIIFCFCLIAYCIDKGQSLFNSIVMS